MNELDEKDELYLKVARLSQSIWENRISERAMNNWLGNFEVNDEDYGLCEQFNALYLLSNFMYFGIKEVRELLKSAYRDKFKNPLIQRIRRDLNETKDTALLHSRFCSELASTRFLGIGNPSESGTHLLYFFRQENDLPKNSFLNTHEILSLDRSSGTPQVRLEDPTIKRYVYIDDICGSGTQATDYSSSILSEIKTIDPNISIQYISLFSTSEGLRKIREETLFDQVDCVFELDDTFKTFSENSRYYPVDNRFPVDKHFTEKFFREYAIKESMTAVEHSLGYKGSQLIIGFSHNTPDNTLPLFWFHSRSWNQAFKRYTKYFLG